jgi:2-keto-4-pentenoate hydratase/2-oxohepta-3-ene-1,7-dioic acid hydratase in catechol pathway
MTYRGCRLRLVLRFVRYSHGSRVNYGVLSPDNKVTPLEGDIFGKWTLGSEKVGFTDAHLLAPVRPPTVIGIGLNYRGHAKESGQPTPGAPVLFLKANTAVAGPGQPIVLPRMAPNEVDYEAELAIVIGKQARNVSEEDAGQYVLGFTCGNDVSARDCQLRLDVQWARGKSFDTFAPLGPWIETDVDGDRCSVQCRLNGEIVQSSNTSDLIFNTRQLVSYTSKCMTLMPGTVIMTGTPAGVGFARKPPVFLRDGDVVEVEVGGIGTLKNPVQNEA